MSRQELADEVNAYLAGKTSRLMDATHVGKLERGDHRWPFKEYREAFRLSERRALIEQARAD